MFHTKGLTFKDAVKACEEGVAAPQNTNDSNVSTDHDMSRDEDLPNLNTTVVVLGPVTWCTLCVFFVRNSDQICVSAPLLMI